ncbi:hypothetical protein GGR58DRAFT_476191 [Xylaria digitata]|nr:hypothetical protein GGR58DRAFT_476191 [Xylaria digitata]
MVSGDQMARSSHPRAIGQIRRVPVPVRDPASNPAPISINTTSPLGITQPTSLLIPPPTQTPLVVRGHHRPRGPIPLVSTNSHQPIPTYFNNTHENNHYSQIPSQYSLHITGMDPESQNRHFTLPPQMEEDIKAAVLASMPPTDRSTPMKKRKTVVHRKRIRWTSLSLCIILVIGEIPVTVIYGLEASSLFAFILGILLALWDGWRLFRLRQKFDNEIISGWHVGLEAASFSALISLTIVVSLWTVNQTRVRQVLSYEDWDSFYLDGAVSQYFWHGVAVAIFFLTLVILHFVLLIITAVEKWTKPAYLQLALPADAQPQQPPQIIVQYCPNCRSHEPRPGEDENSYLASIGDSQPQGVAPASLMKQKEAAEKEGSLNEHGFYEPVGRVRT